MKVIHLNQSIKVTQAITFNSDIVKQYEPKSPVASHKKLLVASKHPVGIDQLDYMIVRQIKNAHKIAEEASKKM